MKPTLLCYHFSAERLSKLRFLCMKLGVTVRVVAPEEESLPLAQLCGMEAEKQAETQPDGAVDREMLVMAGFSGPMVNALLASMKQFRFAPVALKAVLTETNVDWTGPYLCRELKKEHEAMHQGKSVHGNA